MWQTVRQVFIWGAIALALIVMFDMSDLETVAGILADGVGNLFNAFSAAG